MAKVSMYVKLRIELDIDDDVYINNDSIDEEFISECDYNFTSNTAGVRVSDSEIVEIDGLVV